MHIRKPHGVLVDVKTIKCHNIHIFKFSRGSKTLGSKTEALTVKEDRNHHILSFQQKSTRYAKELSTNAAHEKAM